MDKNRIIQLAQERIDVLDKGLFIVDLTISAKNVINVELDMEKGGVSIEDCISVSRNIEHNLNREIEDFELNVSSAGMDRPLRHEKQFLKNAGRKITVLKTNGELIEATLANYKEGTFWLSVERVVRNEKKKKSIVVEELCLDKIEIKEIKRVISFK
ncbi:MAG: ribosome assembly cofactor RimP [Bacteroidetes bacterium]|nr:ribosome assembly cofactor RimP [Bacteroidota bacterium]